VFDAEDAISIIEVPELPPAPRKGMVVVTCMDSRLDVFSMLNLAIGDAHILRNAGGRVTDDTLRSLVLSMHMMNTREVFVIHHTGCGLHRVSNNALQARVTENTGEDASSLDFLPFDDVIESVREDAQRVRDLPLLPEGITVTGAVYDVHSGTLYRVKQL
jgi:carbonic anhydrase